MYTELPTELVVKILQILDLREILRCRMVEKRFRDIVDSTPQLQYKVELAVAYCTDNASNDLAVTEKLHLLREFQAAWKRARFGLGASLPYEYDWAYAGNVLHREFEFKALSTGGKDGIETRSWTLDPGFLDFFLLETALDPAQNLAVFLGMNKSNLLLHVMTLSKGEPLLDEPLEVFGPEMDDMQTTLRVHGHLAALAFVGVPSSNMADDTPAGTEYSTVVNIYDIRKGALLTTLTCSSGAGHSNARDLFGFISTDAFVLGSYVGGNYSLELHALDPRGARTADGPARARHVATYRFPPISPETFTTGWLLDESTNGALGLPEPFLSLPNAPMLAIKRAYMHGDRHRREERITCVFAIPFTVFLDEAAAYRSRLRGAAGVEGAGAPRVLAWGEWGPAGTRCITVPNDILMNPKASLTCHGFRLLVHEPHSSTLLDFNRLDIARDLRRHREGAASGNTDTKASGSTNMNLNVVEEEQDVVVAPYPGRVILRPTTMPAGFFTEDVVTRLPYRETRVEWVGGRPSRIVDGNPTLTCTGEPTGHGGLNITEYRVLVIDPS